MNYYFCISAIAVATILCLQGVQGQQGHRSQIRRQLNNNNCICNFRRISRSCDEFASSEYPDYETMFPASRPKCIPDIPINTRVCFLTTVRACRNSGGLFNGCWLVAGGRNLDFWTRSLDLSGSENETIVTLKSLNRTAKNAVCFYNVNVSAPNDTNSTGIILQSASGNARFRRDVSAEIPEADNSTTSSNCKSYLKFYYTRSEESGKQSHKACVKDVMRGDFNLTIPGVSSLLAVYWTNNDESNIGNSFQIQARSI